MNAVISIHSGAALLRKVELADGTYQIGSSGCEIPLTYPTVSRRHGRIEVRGRELTYTDLGSRNGSGLAALGAAPRLLAADHPTSWSAGSRLHIGPFQLSWEIADRNSTAAQGTGEMSLLERHAQTYARLLSENPAGARDALYEAVRLLPNCDQVLELIHREFHGDGPLHEYLEHPSCREILINGPDEIYVDLGLGLTRSASTFLSRETFEAWAVRTAHAAGRRLDLQHPICEATLANGARFHAVLAPVSSRGLSVAIRRFGSAPVDEQLALESGWLDREALALIKAAVTEKQNIVISGGTSTGKTSLLNFLSRYFDPSERVITVEDTVELAPPVRNLVQLQARSANADGVGGISLRSLVQCALRMRPDRIVVGECRGSEVLEMLQALNTGHPGSLTTVHANSTDEALQRLELLTLLGAPNLSVECIREWIRSSIHMIIQVERDSAGHRHVFAIDRLVEGSFNAVYRRTRPQHR